MVKQASREYFVTAAGVRKTIKIVRATKHSLKATVSTTDNPVPLINFDIKPGKRPVRINQNGSRYPKIYRSRIMRDKTPKGVERMFIVKKHVLIRPADATRKDNLNPNNWLAFGLSIPQMIGYKDNIKEIKDAAIKKLSERVNHEINYRLMKGD